MHRGSRHGAAPRATPSAAPGGAVTNRAVTSRAVVSRAVTGLVTAGLVMTGLLAGCTQQPPAVQPPGSPAATPSAEPPAAPSTTAPLPLPRPQPPGGPRPPEPGLDAADRARLIAAHRAGAQWVTLLVATEPARTAEVAAGLRELGGVLGTSDPGAGYLRLTMPTGQVERAAALPGITGVDIEQVISPQKPRPTG